MADPPAITLSARCECLRAQLEVEIGSTAVFKRAYKYLHAVMNGDDMEDPSIAAFHDVLTVASDGNGLQKMTKDETEDLLSEMILLIHLEGALLKAAQQRPKE